MYLCYWIIRSVLRTSVDEAIFVQELLRLMDLSDKRLTVAETLNHNRNINVWIRNECPYEQSLHCGFLEQ